MCTTFCMPCAVVTVTVQQPSYPVQESAGSVTVCAILSGVTLERALLVDVMTQDGTAMGV